MLFNANPFEQLARGDYVGKTAAVQTCDWSKVLWQDLLSNDLQCE